jgi:hypothetical protein
MAGEVCVLDSLAPVRGLNLFSALTQDFRPGLLSVAPAGAGAWRWGAGSPRLESSSATLHECGRSRFLRPLHHEVKSSGRGRPLYTIFGQRQRTGVSLYTAP